jgi:hypothetical protein
MEFLKLRTKRRFVNGVKAPWRNATFSDDVERILPDLIIVLEEQFGGELIIKDI